MAGGARAPKTIYCLASVDNIALAVDNEALLRALLEAQAGNKGATTHESSLWWLELS